MLFTVVEIYHFWRSLLPHSSTIKMELAGSSEDLLLSFDVFESVKFSFHIDDGLQPGQTLLK
jgi:hypothetical protein